MAADRGYHRPAAENDGDNHYQRHHQHDDAAKTINRLWHRPRRGRIYRRSRRSLSRGTFIGFLTQYRADETLRYFGNTKFTVKIWIADAACRLSPCARSVLAGRAVQTACSLRPTQSKEIAKRPKAASHSVIESTDRGKQDPADPPCTSPKNSDRQCRSPAFRTFAGLRRRLPPVFRPLAAWGSRVRRSLTCHVVPPLGFPCYGDNNRYSS